MRVPNPPSLIPNPDLDVRKHDEDRWLASRFAPADVRARLIAIYALNHEIARTADVVSQAAIGDIRLAWWREALAEIADGKPARAHAVLQALDPTGARQSLAVWERLIEARGKDLDPAPFADWSALEAYLDATAGGVMRIAMAACAVEPTKHEAFTRAAALAWGCVGVLRSEPHWRAKSRSMLPPGGASRDLAERARRAIDEARRLSATLPAAAFPAVGYVALAPGYLRAQARGRETTPLLTRQLRLIASAATGRF